MPLLERAKKVTLFAFSSQPSALRKSAEMLVDHLAAHGVKAEHISDWTNTGDLTAVEALFASLDTQDADLIVAGAFGHSRLYEGLFGGVTRDLMHQQSLPVLMSHCLGNGAARIGYLGFAAYRRRGSRAPAAFQG